MNLQRKIRIAKVIAKKDGLGILICGIALTGVVCGVSCMVEQVYDSVTADLQVNQTEKPGWPMGGRSIYGYDTDKNGSIDKIKETYAFYGAKGFVMPFKKNFERDEEGFEELEEILLDSK
jgi:hypothetical protein